MADSKKILDGVKKITEMNDDFSKIIGGETRANTELLTTPGSICSYLIRHIVFIQGNINVIQKAGYNGIKYDVYKSQYNIKIENAIVDAVKTWLPYLKIEKIIFDYHPHRLNLSRYPLLILSRL